VDWTPNESSGVETYCQRYNDRDSPYIKILELDNELYGFGEGGKDSRFNKDD
jgi:hypothetical protein